MPHFFNRNTNTAHERDPRPLPPGWEQRVDDRGLAYFLVGQEQDERKKKEEEKKKKTMKSKKKGRKSKRGMRKKK